MLSPVWLVQALVLSCCTAESCVASALLPAGADMHSGGRKLLMEEWGSQVSAV